MKNIGIEGIQPPEKTCNDKNCPWHGEVRIHGRIFRGKVIKARDPKTVLIEFHRYIYIPKYERYEVRITRIRAHNPECISAKEGDEVIIGETRPISKAKKFVVLQIVKKSSEQ